MAKVEGLDKLKSTLKSLIKKLEDNRAKSSDSNSVEVGFTAAYAIYVHENLTAQHPVGQAKFLEQPFRLLRQELFDMVAKGIEDGLTPLESLLRAGYRLQREAQKLTPVDTGNLKSSAFTRVGDAQEIPEGMLNSSTINDIS